MKYKFIPISILALILIGITMGMMLPNVEPEPEPEYAPILMTREALESSIQFQEPKTDLTSQRIYIYGDNIYLIEAGFGVQVINNLDPTNPQPERYIAIPGCHNIAIRNSIMFASSAVDIIGIDYINEQVLFRNENVIDEPVPPGEPVQEYYERPENSIVIGWNKL